MAGELILGVDIGTYGSKGVLCRPDGGVVASAEVEHGMDVPRPGWAEQDADAVWWADFVQLARRLGGAAPRGAIGAVGVSAIGPCLLPVDAAGRSLRPGILYGIDTRASAEVDELTGAIGAEGLLALGGMGLSSQAMGPKILWLARHEPEVWARTACVLSASSYLVMRLTGERVMDMHTASHYNPLFDLDGLTWSGRYGDLVPVGARLPRLAWPSEVAGRVGAAAAAETGLAVGTPVAVGTVDAAAEAVSVGVRAPGDMMLMYGTTTFFILVTPGPVRQQGMWSTAYAVPGAYDLAAGMATTGALTRWFRDGFARELGDGGSRRAGTGGAAGVGGAGEGSDAGAGEGSRAGRASGAGGATGAGGPAGAGGAPGAGGAAGGGPLPPQAAANTGGPAGHPSPYAALTAEAEGVPPGSMGLVVLPYFSGERTPIQDPDARGVVAGLTLAHGRGHLYRALLEGTAYGVRHNLESMRALGAEVRRVVAVGGGTRSRLWLQIVSDVTGVAQELPAQTIGAAYGDAFLAGWAAGLVPGLQALDAWVRPGEVVRPDPEAVARYAPYYRVYRELYEATKAQCHALAALGRQ